MEDGIEVEGIRIVFEKMKKEYENGGDIEESENMMEEDEMGEKELKKGIGEINQIQKKIGEIYEKNKGMKNEVLMKYVMKKKRDEIEKRIERMEDYIGIEGGLEGFEDEIMKMREEIGVKRKMKDIIKKIKMENERKEMIEEMEVEDKKEGGKKVEIKKKEEIKLINEELEGR